MAKRVRPPWAIGIEAKSSDFRAEGVPLLILDPPAGAIATMAATNKCLAESNKSCTAGKATKKRTLAFKGGNKAKMRALSMMIAGIVALLASPSLAGERSELEKATIKAASDCVAAAALNNPNITLFYRESRLKEITDWIVLKSNACENQLTAMRLLHDKLYGAGTGRGFVLGDYLADLPRAVGERIRFEVERRIPEEKNIRRAPPSPHVQPDLDGPVKPSTGNEWVAECNSSDLGKLTGCMSYARGIADGLRTWEFLYPNAPVCIPQAVVTSQLVDVGRNYIRNNPGARQEGAGVQGILAVPEGRRLRESAGSIPVLIVNHDEFWSS